jgi:hypothetical protein
VTTPLRGTRPSTRERRKPVVPPAGEDGLISAALSIGILLMGIQLWILTVSLEHFERHEYPPIYALAGISALIFAGGVMMLWLLRRTPAVGRSSVPSSSLEEKPTGF